MPTPFTHLQIADRLLQDDHIPAEMRALIDAERGAFLLGNIAADARVSSGLRREDTHFYAYDRPITERPWRVMTRMYESLFAPHSLAQRAFIAGYVAHLTVDEVWSLEMVYPYFALSDWGTRQQRFVMLHIILIYMDERDYSRLPLWERDSLYSAQPQTWSPFIPDTDLEGWRDFVATQLQPDGVSETLSVFGDRIQLSPAHLRAILDSPDQMERDLWQHVPHAVLGQVEESMYQQARDQMLVYLDESR